jgi:hypothetical protein
MVPNVVDLRRRLDSSGSEQGQIVGSCEYGNEFAHSL